MSAPASPPTPDHVVAGEILDLVLSRRRVLYLGRSMVAARDMLVMVDQLGRNGGVVARAVRATGLESYTLVDDDRGRARFLSVRSSLHGQVTDVVIVHATVDELPRAQTIRGKLSGTAPRFGQDLEVLRACGGRVEYR